jgi:DNA repair protein SbcD/Mre11
MRILHSSDWHLGRRLHGESLAESHERFLTWLHSEVLAETRPDLLVVSGDIYDRGVPPTDAIELLEDSLAEIQNRGIPVLITAGNHDSRVRLGINSRFMAGVGLHLRTRLKDITAPVQIDSDDFTLLAYGIPYLEPEVDTGPADHQWDVESSQTGVLAEAMRRINVDIEARQASSSKPIRTLVASHAFVQGATSSDSERNIKDVKVGGLGQADAAVFNGVDYVAMGHIHRPHASNEIKGPGSTLLRYSGSPIPFSFSERSDVKQLLLVEFSKDGVKDEAISSIPAPKIRGMQQIEGTLQEILSEKFQESDDWVKVILKDKEIPINVFETIKRKYRHLLDLDHRSSFVGDDSQGRGEVLLQNLTPEEVTRRFVGRITQEEITPDVSDAIDSCCAEVRVELSQVNK